MKQILYRLFNHQTLSKEEAKEVLTNIAEGRYNDSQIAAFITVYLMRSVQVEEVLGFREALLEMRVNVDSLQAYNPIDIVGTGGDNKNTFNISTATSFVVAGAGYKVAKHGNYAATSVSGASTVLEEHGVTFTKDLGELERSLELTNLAYLHAPFFNLALKTVAPVRKTLGVRSFFNVLGPLVNPIQPKRQMLGVYDLKMARLYHYIYEKMEVDYAIVHSLDGYDEISLTAPFQVITTQGEFMYTPEEMGSRRFQESDLEGGASPKEAAAIFLQVLQHQATEAQHRCVVSNAAFAIQTIEPQKSLSDCLATANESILSGSAFACFKKFVDLHS